MKKRFFTLMAGLFLAGTLSSAAQSSATEMYPSPLGDQPAYWQSGYTKSADVMGAKQIKAFDGSLYYQLVVSQQQVGSGSFPLNQGEGTYVLVQERNAVTGELFLTAVESTEAPLVASLWKVKTGSDAVSGKYFTFENKAFGSELVFDPNRAETKISNPTAGVNRFATPVDGCVNKWKWYSTFEQKTNPFGPKQLFSYTEGEDEVLVLQIATSSIPPVAVGYDQPMNAYPVILAKYSAEAAEDEASNVNGALMLTPVIANPLVLTPNDVNMMIDAQTLGEAAFKFSPENKNVLSNNKFIAESEAIVRSAQGSSNLTQEQIAEYMSLRLSTTEGDDAKYLMVDTARYRENDVKPTESPSLNINIRKYADISDITTMTNDMLKERYLFKLTYYATNDSLLLEPADASSMGDGNWNNKKLWKDRNLTQNADFPYPYNSLSKGRTVALNLVYLNADLVLSVVTPDQGAFKSRISFDHKYNYYERTTLEPGVYFINLATEFNSPQMLTKKTGNNLVIDMCGVFAYDKEEKAQGFTHMPATQWVVEQIGCGDASRVRISNREFAGYGEYDVYRFEFQLYKNEAGDLFFMNPTQEVNMMGGRPAAATFLIGDAFKATKIEKPTTEGYKNIDPADMKVNTYVFNQFFNYGENPYNLNVAKAKNDTIVRAQETATQFELEIAPAMEGRTFKYMEKYGYAVKGVADTLYRTAYSMKVKDADKIDNDYKYFGVDDYDKYVVSFAKNYAYEGEHLRLARFFLKENNHWDGKEYFAIVDIAPEYEMGITSEGRYYMESPYKLGIEEGSMDAKLEGACESRTSAFDVTTVNMPLYRTIDPALHDKNIKIYNTTNANRILFEDGMRKGLSCVDKAMDLGLGYLGIHSAKENTKNEALYVDPANVDNHRGEMPLYMFAVRLEHKETLGCEHFEHHDPYTGHFYPREYKQGAYLVDLDQLDTIGYVKDNTYERVYRRLGFVNAIHMGDTLYILKSQDAVFDYEFDIKDPANWYYALDLKNEDMAPEKYDEEGDLIKGDYNKGANHALRLKIHETDTENGEFYIETWGPFGGFTGNSWVKEQNNDVMVLAKKYEENEDHHGLPYPELEYVNEGIHQAMLMQLAATDDPAVANPNIAVGKVTAIAGQGKVTILGAAGKKVSISNILGKSIAKQVVNSDNATFAAPAGVVVIEVEGQAAIKAFVK